MKKYLQHIVNALVILFMVIALGLAGFYLTIKLSNQMIEKATDPAQKYTVTCNQHALTCEVYLKDTISNSDSYTNLYTLIQTAPKGSTINLHLDGHGGDVGTVLHLYNVIKSSEAEVNTLIEGPVLSAHAMIALMGKHIVVSDATYFMFHMPAIYDSIKNEYVKSVDICEYYHGKKDRGQDEYQKCLDNMAAETEAENAVFGSTMYKYLNLEEQWRLHQGFDVYVSAADMQQRVKNAEEGEL